MERRKAAVFALGALGLAGALTLAAFAAPERARAVAAARMPSDPGEVIARVPRRDPVELAARRALASAPDDVELAVRLAHAELGRARASSDPRYLGRAQALLAPWWQLEAPPPEVLLLRATILQSLHEFSSARADLDRLIAIRPDDAQAQLTRAVVATVTGDYPAARASCSALARLASALIATTCVASLDGLAGQAEQAYARLAQALAAARDPVEIRGWAATTLAELAIQRGDLDAALDQLGAIVARDPEDAYARTALADVLLAAGRAGEASALLAGREQVDSALVRRAIAEHVARGPDAARLAQAMRDRLAAAAERGDLVHLREEARFALEVEADPRRALRVARDNWGVQKELADARLFAKAAVAAHDAGSAAPVVAWARRTGVRDVELDRSLRQLEVLR
jgi:DNA-binding SARP family transcriptional activator